MQESYTLIDELCTDRNSIVSVFNTGSFYIGLHNAAMRSDTVEYFWTDCTPLQQYVNLQTNGYLRYCAILYTNFGWDVTSCSDLRSFVCETDGSRCRYFQYINMKGTKGISFNATVMGQNDCLRLCDEAILNGMECWGVTYYIYTETCILHLSNDSTIFDNGGKTSNTGSYLFKKQCLKVDVDKTVFPSGSSTNIPFSNCYTTSSTGSIYTIFERAVTWQEAKDVCSNIGASLLEYRSHEEFTDFDYIARPLLYGFSSIWFGLRRYNNLTFLWQDGTGITNWDKWENQPSNIPGTCVQVDLADSSHGWLDDNCTKSHPFVCEQPGVCAFKVFPNTIGDSGIVQSFSTRKGCMRICENNSTCIAYSGYYDPTYFYCKTHHQSDIYYYFNSQNYYNKLQSTFYRYSCSHALRIGNMSVEVPKLYHPSGINLGENTFVSLSTHVEESTSLMQDATIGVREPSETFSFTVSVMETTEASESFTESSSDVYPDVTTITALEKSSLMQDATSVVSELSEESAETFPFTVSFYNSIEATESLSETESSTDESNHPSLETTQFSGSTFYYTETVELTETLKYSSNSLDNLDLSNFDSYTDSVTPSSTLPETTLIGDISMELTENFSESVSTYTNYEELIPTNEMPSHKNSDIEPSFTSLINGYVDKSIVVVNTKSLQTLHPSEFPTLYPPKQSKYLPICPCGCVSRVISGENIKDRIQELVEDLTLDKRNLSSTLHSLSSIEDDRPSAQTLGYSSVILLVCVFSFFLIMDIIHFIIQRSAVLVITK
ncbi:hypothetical protein LOTGIDRAFT_155620 [Lottia gigantea]|uniref:C-type lectin domain-containing protein n=1 Tax=Lottia gigantea TaxID=225164 RepID=V3ZP26_LOTGI|nr:hypothetical protein LOTGIDRAFT_155620 [Lottia gigantea]ESO82606.1 hypothetical protein LOTGIDRAFT_155620 [Lottia gigantea]